MSCARMRGCWGRVASALADRGSARRMAGGGGGLGCAWRKRVLRTLAYVDLANTGLYMPMESVLFPKYFTDRNEPAHLGWVLMALSIGGLIGALGYAVLSQYMKKRTTMLIAVLTLGVAMTVIAFLPPLALVLGLWVVVGIGGWILGRFALGHVRPAGRIAARLVFVATLVAAGWGVWKGIETRVQAASPSASQERFTEATLPQLRASGKPWFLYFTADWCTTCLVNEGAALHRRWAPVRVRPPVPGWRRRRRPACWPRARP